MTKRKVIDDKNLPARWPLAINCFWWMFFDYIGIPAWGWGIFWTIAAILWVVFLVDIFTQVKIDVVANK